jgi:hypothetical protein
MWLKAQNEMAGLWPLAAMGPVERMVRPRRGMLMRIWHTVKNWINCGFEELQN